MPGGRPPNIDAKGRNFIVENTVTMTDAQIAEHLGVSQHCVTKTRQRMGIKKSGRRGNFRVSGLF